LAVCVVDGHTGQSGAAPDRYCSLSGVCHVSTSVGVWSDLTVGTLCTVAAPDSPVPHWTCPMCSDFSVLTSAGLFTTVHFWKTTVDVDYRCSVGSPDMSGAHRTFR
jgi:hypothetical protein